MNAGNLSKTMTETLRRLVRLQLLTFRKVDSEHVEVRHGERHATVALLTGHWEGGTAKGSGIFSLGRHLGLDDQAVIEAWTKALQAR